VGGYNQSLHASLADCDDCHLTAHPANTHFEHGFHPTLAACNVGGCHGAAPLGTFDRPSPDYDGDLLAEGVQSEVMGLLALLESQIVSSPNIWKSLDGMYFVDSDPSLPGYPGDAAARRLQLPGITDPQRRAVFNHYTVERERSRGVHNTAYAVRLLQQSFIEIGGASPPWALR
jgi:hypothetical protein